MDILAQLYPWTKFQSVDNANYPWTIGEPSTSCASQPKLIMLADVDVKWDQVYYVKDA